MIKKIFSLLLSLTLVLGLPTITYGQPGEGGMGGEGGSSSSDISWSGATEISSAGTYESPGYTSETSGQNAVLVKHSSGKVTMTSPTVSKTGSGGTSDDYNFYGINAAVMCKDGGTTVITGGTVETSADGANAVFSYGGYPSTDNTSTDGTTVDISNTTIKTTGNGAGGIMTTGGGIMKASNLDISTTGGSSAPIRTDRGGGDVDVTGGTYTSSGTGSPAIYSVTDVDVSEATLVSNASEGVVIEGAGSVELKESCKLTGNNTSLNGNAQFYDTVMIYQSMSGDASDGTSLFTMNGGSITSKKGHVFHITNTDGKVNLTGVDITNEDSDNVFLSVCDDGWSSSGQTAVVTATDQTIEGNMLVGSNSTLTLNLKGTSAWTGTTSGNITNGKNSVVSSSLGTVNVTMSDSAHIKLSADTTISSISGEGTIDYNGHTLTVESVSYDSGTPGVDTITEATQEQETVEVTKVEIPQGRTLTYNGSKRTGVVSKSTYTLSGTYTATKAGSYKATAKLKDTTNYTWADGTTEAKTIAWTINKAANPLTIKAKTATVKYSNLQKKAQVLSVSKVITFTKKGQGTLTYTKSSGNKNITINKKTGKVTIKKGLKKGTYKVKVKVKAAGNTNYKASAVKTVTFSIKVK